MKRFASIILSFILILNFTITSLANEKQDIDKIISDTIEYVYETVKSPQFGSIGGEWTVIALARSNTKIPPKYYQDYYNGIEEYVRSKQGVLHKRKYTEYSRLILSLTAIGKNPQDVAGYNLLVPLGDYKKTIWQGINGAIWALISLDSGNYEIPKNPEAEIQATREMYVEHILSCQLGDGGWSLLGRSKSADDGKITSDPDITAMAVQALSKYQDMPRVKDAIDKALGTMSENQDEKGGFSSWGCENSESCVQMIVALCELGISIDDTRFVKNDYTIIDNLLCYYNEGKGFKHTLEEDNSNLMATEQALYGLIAYQRMISKKSSLYKMDDVITIAQKDNDIEKAESKFSIDKRESVLSMDFENITKYSIRDMIKLLAGSVLK